MINTAVEEGRKNRTIQLVYFSEKDGMVISREGFPYEVKDQTLFYYDFQEKGTRRAKLSNLKSVTPTGRINPGTPYPCKL